MTDTPAPRAAIEAAAREGDAAAQAAYGQLLLDRGEPAAALGWFAAGAKQGNAMALNMMGRCYDLGWGTATDKARAAECYRAASDRGLVEAAYNLATLMTLGEGVAQDRAGALALFERAAAAGYAKADNYVGSFAEDGWAGPVDMARAASAYARAADGGDFRGCFNHARMLIASGRLGEALPWIERAGRLGNERFVRQVAQWLRGQAAAVATSGSAALSAGIAASC